MPRLVYTTDQDPGITRKGAGTGFYYINPDGNKVKNDATLQRIRSLAIPPAYKSVWICSMENGHPQENDPAMQKGGGVRPNLLQHVKDGRGRRASLSWLEARAENEGGKVNDAAMNTLRRGWYLGEPSFGDKLHTLVSPEQLRVTG